MTFAGHKTAINMSREFRCSGNCFELRLSL